MGRFIIPYGHHSGEHHGNYGNHRGYGGYGNHGSQIQTDKNGTVCRSWAFSKGKRVPLNFSIKKKNWARDGYTKFRQRNWNFKIFDIPKLQNQNHMGMPI